MGNGKLKRNYGEWDSVEEREAGDLWALELASGPPPWEVPTGDVVKWECPDL